MPTHNNNTPKTIAAIDLGSNSFHMIVARVINGEIQIIDRIREMVRLGAGLDENRELSLEARIRALACLSRFGQRLRELPTDNVRAVGTNALRQAKRAGNFLTQAETALKHPIEIISGREEARLVYLGVAHSLATGDKQRLVVDIGGGSTELIIGKQFDIQLRESLYMGCVNISQQHFPHGAITTDTMKAAELAAALELRPIRRSYRDLGWKAAIGSSGTIRSIGAVIQHASWGKEGITLESLNQLREALISAGHTDKLIFEGLSPERQAVFPGGVAVLLAIFKTLHLDKMQVSEQALREGLLYDKLGRIQHEDIRERTILSLCARYHLDLAHAKHVETTANKLFAQASKHWGLTKTWQLKILCWATRIHELGLTISHNQFHKHGAYLIENSDLSGFSRQEQMLLAALVRGQRRKFPLEAFELLPSANRESTKRLCILLRLAILLHRGRSTKARPFIKLTVEENSLELTFPQDWLKRHPLTKMELKQEELRLDEVGFTLRYNN